jgi:hypothetical protein
MLFGLLGEVGATNTKLGAVRCTGGRVRAAPAALLASPAPARLQQQRGVSEPPRLDGYCPRWRRAAVSHSPVRVTTTGQRRGQTVILNPC